MFAFLKRSQHKNKKQKELYTAVKHITGFNPRQINLYEQALKHSSVTKSQIDNNERLEYLGDAIIGSVVAEYLFKKFPYKTEGFLTETRSRMVNRETLNEIARKIGLDELVEYSINRNLPNSHKSVYGNALEAFVGAVYLDKGYYTTQKFITQKLFGPHIDIDTILNTIKNYKSALIEWAQKEGKDIRFEIVSEKGSNHHKEFTAQVYIENEPLQTGKGLSKKKAEQAAAEKTYESLDI